MKYLILILLLAGCSSITTSKHRCDNKVSVEKAMCIESYENYVRNRDYREFRAGAGKLPFYSNL